MKIKIYTILTYTVFISWLCLLGYVVYSLTYPFELQHFKTSKLPVLKKVVLPGEVLPVSFEFDRYMEGPVLVIRKLKNDFVLPLSEEVTTDREKGHYKFVSYLTIIPEHAAPGTYTLEYSFIYIVNPLRTIIKRIETESFTVLKSPKRP